MKLYVEDGGEDVSQALGVSPVTVTGEGSGCGGLDELQGKLIPTYQEGIESVVSTTNRELSGTAAPGVRTALGLMTWPFVRHANDINTAERIAVAAKFNGRIS